LRTLADEAIKANDIERAIGHLRASSQTQQARNNVQQEIQRLERGVAR